MRSKGTCAHRPLSVNVLHCTSIVHLCIACLYVLPRMWSVQGFHIKVHSDPLLHIRCTMSCPSRSTPISTTHHRPRPAADAACTSVALTCSVGDADATPKKQRRTSEYAAALPAVMIGGRFNKLVTILLPISARSQLIGTENSLSPFKICNVTECEPPVVRSLHAQTVPELNRHPCGCHVTPFADSSLPDSLCPFISGLAVRRRKFLGMSRPTQMSDELTTIPLPLKKRKSTDIISVQQQEIHYAHVSQNGGDGKDADGAPHQKRLSITTSKILGTAQPHKPRIGPRYQADLPPLQPRPAQK